MADDDWQPVGKPTMPTDTAATDWQPVNADFDARFSAVDIPRPFTERLERAYSGGLNRMGELAASGLTQLGKGVGQIMGKTAPEPLSDTVKQVFGISPDENSDRIANAQRHWQIARGFGNVIAGAGSYMGSPLGLLSGGLQGVTASPTQNPYPQEATEIFAGVIGPAFVKWGSDAMKFAKATEVGEKVIGQLPNDRDFRTGAQAIIAKQAETAQEGIGKLKEGAEKVVDLDDRRDQLATAEGNLRRLWNERGLHPAEAVDEANRNALGRHDLINQPSHAIDNSGIPPVLNSPQPHGVARSTLAHTGLSHVDAILDSEPVRTVIDDPIVNRKYDVPYTAGGSVPEADRTFFVDKDFPRSFTIDGVTFDPAEPFAVHENVEQHTMDILTKGGMDDATAYKVAHFEFAEKAEGAWYKAHGIDQKKAEAAYAPYMAAIQRGQLSSEGGIPNLFAREGETGRPMTKSSGEAPPGVQPPLPQVSTLPPPSGISTTRATLPSPTAKGPITVFRAFKLGDTDEASNKNILQGTNDYKALLARAEENKPKLVARLNELVKDVPGASVYGARVKDEPGLVEKIESKKRSPNTISDYLGARIVVDHPDAMNEVIDRIEATGSIIEVEDFINSSKEGYRAYHLQVGLGDGTSAEIQLVPKPIADVMEKSHALRQPIKRMDISTPEGLANFKAAMTAARNVSDEAWKKAGPEWNTFYQERPLTPGERGNFPPNLYTRPYPHDQPSAAATEAIAEPRPTPAEIDRAKQIITDWQQSGGLRSEFPGTVQRVKGYFRVPTFVNGKEIGNTDVLYYPGDSKIQINSQYLDEAHRGKGLGLDAVKKLVDWAHSKGLDVESSLDLNKYSTRVYEGLKKRGYEVQAPIFEKKTDFGAELNIPRRGYFLPAPAVRELPPREEIARAAQIIEDAQKEGKIHSLGAAATEAQPPPLTPLAKQPLSLPGRLSAAGRYSVDQLFSLGRSIQGMLDPMSTGSNRAMIVAEDAMNSVRAIRWNRLRIDADIKERFTPEQQERMYNAMQEESIARQLNEPREHQGYATLEPAERAYVEGLERRGQAAWTHMLDADMVEGEGLPAWSPRMFVNLAMAGEGLGPRALNELGRNVFTRTAQMRHRKYMQPEESEEAARAGLRQIMEKRGASAAEIKEATEKVQIVRNIRTLPQAIAREEEAVVWKTMIDRIEEAGKAAGTPTVADHQVDKNWFTIAGHPAFTKWMPDLVPAETETIREAFKAKAGMEMRGAMIPRRDEDGNIIFKPQSIWIAPEFRGPITAILDQNKTFPGHQVYDALMALKARSMTAIMNSPLIHNEVVLSKVAEAVHFREWGGMHLYWRGNRVVNSPRAIELINRGLNPIGPRGSFQDITAELEQPSFKPGRSWTSQVLGFIPGLFKPEADAALERAIDKAGDFVHNTMLWDRVRDLQFGLADHLSDRLVAQGQPRVVADRMASYFSNIIIGSLPKESMSTGARMVSNLLLFSRSFTIGNLLMYRSAVNGLPKPLLAQIERDYGISAAEGAEAAGKQMAGMLTDAKAMARRRALSTIALSIGMYYMGNALLQNALNIAINGSDLPDEMKGYARRYHDLISAVNNDPWEMRHAIARLSPTWDNEPGKQDRALAGYDRDGTAIYVRNPMGKYGEEMLGYPTMPAEMITRKLSPTFGGFLDILENNRGFGHRIYDENDTSDAAALNTAWNVGKYMVERQLPMMQLQGGYDLLAGHGDPKVAGLRFAGPIFGFTASEGAPSGPARGEQLSVKNAFESRFDIAWPGIKRQIQDGNETAARDALARLGTPPGMVKALIRNAKNPSMALRGRTIRDFYSEASPEARSRFERDFAPGQ